MWHLREWKGQKALPGTVQNQYEQLLPLVVKTSNWAGPLSK